MKTKTLAIIAAVITTAALLTTAVLAANTTTFYNVLANGIKIVIDGQKIKPTDANGNVVEPIIYNGTTYLPVRAVATALGKAVYWDGPNYTVYLGDMDGKLKYPTVELRDLTSIANKHIITTTPQDNYGTRYTYALQGSGVHDGRTYEYLTNMQYSKFKGVLYVDFGTNENFTGQLEIIADGRRIYVSPQLDKTSRPIYLDINITGYNDIQIKFLGNLSFYGYVHLADAGFYQ